MLPANNATVSGTLQYFDDIASGATSVTYQLSGGPSDLSNVQIATATLTFVGWAAAWNTTTVANGSYTLNTDASYSGGITATSAPITITVDNAPPSTTVVYPASGASVPGSDTEPIVMDAVASPGVTSIVFNLSVAGEVFSATATLTIVGWIGSIPSMGSGGADCPPLSFPGTIQSVASYPGGVSGTSGPSAFR